MQQPAVLGQKMLVNRFSILPFHTVNDRVTVWAVECFADERLSIHMEQAIKHMHVDAHEMKVWVTPEGRIEDCSQGWADRFGFQSREACYGRYLYECLNTKMTHQFNDKYGFKKKLHDHLMILMKECYENREAWSVPLPGNRVAERGEVKIHFDAFHLLHSAPRMEMLQQRQKEGKLRQGVITCVNRFTVRPYITDQDGKILQYVCSCIDEPFSPEMVESLITEGIEDVI
jgi:hypothetical protein